MKKAILTIIALALAIPTFAAKYENIDKMSSQRLERLHQHANKTVGKEELFGTCNVVITVKITEKKKREKWENTLKQILWGNYIESVSAGELEASEKNDR